jgi:hypothetical protein
VPTSQYQLTQYISYPKDVGVLRTGMIVRKWSHIHLYHWYCETSYALQSQDDQCI